MEGENRSWRGCKGEGGRQVGGGHMRDWAHSGVRMETLRQCSGHYYLATGSTQVDQ